MGGERFDFLDKRDFLEKLLGWAEGSGEQSSQHQQRMCILAVLLHRRWEFFYRVGLVILGGKLQWFHGMYPSWKITWHEEE